MARVALALLGGQRARRLDLVAAVLPQREAAGHRLDVLVAEVLDQRPCRPRRAVARRAVQDHVLRRDRGRRPRSATRDSSWGRGWRRGCARPTTPRARGRRRRPRRSDLLAHGGRIDLVDPALDLAENLGSGRAHRENSSNAVGIQYFREYSERRAMSQTSFSTPRRPRRPRGDPDRRRRAQLRGAAPRRGRAGAPTRRRGRVAVWAEPTLELCVAVRRRARRRRQPSSRSTPASARASSATSSRTARPSGSSPGPGVEAPAELAAPRPHRRRSRRATRDRAAARRARPTTTSRSSCTRPGPRARPRGFRSPAGRSPRTSTRSPRSGSGRPRTALAHALPVFHVHGLVIGMLGPLRRGGPSSTSAASPRRRSPARSGAARRWCSASRRCTAGSPRRGRERRGPRRRVRDAPALLVSGSAALPTTVHERHRSGSPARTILERYGLTETLMNAGARLGDDGRPRPRRPARSRASRSSSSPRTATTIDASDDETIGEVAVRGPNVFTGYLNRPDATEEAMRDGWFMTGDMATRNEAGSLQARRPQEHRPDQVGRLPDRRRRDRGRAARAPGGRRGGGDRRPDDDLGERIVAWVVTRARPHRRPPTSCRTHVADPAHEAQAPSRGPLRRRAAPQRDGQGHEARAREH